MKFFKILFVALVAMIGFNSCSDDCDHDFIEHDFTKDIVGTWTTLNGELAEAMVIKADGSFTTTGVMKGGSLYEEKGTIKVVNNKVTLAFDGDKETFEGRLEFVAGKSLSLVMFDDNAARLTYDYCANDLSDEIVGMWVCNDGLENDIAINTFAENGKSYITTFLADENDYVLNKEGDYKVIGNLLIKTVKGDSNTSDSYIVIGLDYMPNGTELGDIMTMYLPAYEAKTTFLRIKQHLELPGMKYDYMKIFISNVNGKDMDVPFFNTTINFANFDSSIFDMFLKSTLFSVQFPNANTIEYSFLLGEQITPMQAPIMVEGNKMTIKMSELNSVYRDVEVYTFQDQDNTQMHMYMHTSTFVDFFGNMQVNLMAAKGQLDMNDAAAVNAVFDSIDDAVETINLSLVMTKAK